MRAQRPMQQRHGTVPDDFTDSPNARPISLSSDGKKFSWNPYSHSSASPFPQPWCVTPAPPERRSPVPKGLGDSPTARCHHEEQKLPFYTPNQQVQSFGSAPCPGAIGCGNAFILSDEPRFRPAPAVTSSPHFPHCQRGRPDEPRDLTHPSPPQPRAFDPSQSRGYGLSAPSMRLTRSRIMIPPPVPYETALQQLTRSGLLDAEEVLNRILRQWHEAVQRAMMEIQHSGGDGAASLPDGNCPPPPREGGRQQMSEWAAVCDEWWRRRFYCRNRPLSKRRQSAQAFVVGQGHRLFDGRRGVTRRGRLAAGAANGPSLSWGEGCGGHK